MRASAYKADIVTMDLVCLAIDTDGELRLGLNEDMDGWKKFCLDFQTYVPQ